MLILCLRGRRILLRISPPGPGIQKVDIYHKDCYIQSNVKLLWEYALTTWIIIILVGIILLLVVVFFLQSRIKIGTYEDFFPIRRTEPAIVEQDRLGNTTLTWDDTLAPEKITLMDSPVSTDAVQTWTAPFDDHCIEVEIKREGFRPFFHLALPQRGDLVVSTRFQPFEHIRNFRDMGGYLTADGQQVTWGVLYRSGQMGRPTPSDLKLLGTLGLRTVIDLRDDGEIEHLPDRVPNTVNYQRVFITDSVMVRKTSVMVRRQRLGREFSESYKRRILEQGAAGIGEVLRTLCDPANLPATIHCTAGKDRAGVVTALILLTLGVPEETVIDDYTLSNRFAQTYIREIERRIRRVRWIGMRTEHFFPMAAARPSVMESTLAYIREAYGSAENYLTNRAGVPPENLARLREAMLVER
jgi:protein-tyrosine phosphatase